METQEESNLFFHHLLEVENNDNYKTYFKLESDLIRTLFNCDHEKIPALIINYLQKNDDNETGSFYWIIQLLVKFYYLRPKERRFLIDLVSLLCSTFSFFAPKFVQYVNTSKYQVSFEGYFCSSVLELEPILKEYGKPIKYHVKNNFSIYEPNSLLFYIKEDDQEKVQLYLAENPTIDITKEKTDTLNTPLDDVFDNPAQCSLIDLAAFYGSSTVFKYLFMNNCKTTDFSCRCAIAGGNIEIIHLLQQEGQNFKNCLHSSIQYHRYELIDWLMLNFDCETVPLFFMVYYFNYDSFFFFLKHRDIDEVDEHGQTVLHTACWNCHYNVVKFLIEKTKAEAEKKNENGFTPLHTACWNGQFPIVKLLIEQAKVDFEAINEDGVTPLHLAAQEGYLDIVQYLYEKGCNINPRTIENETPLHLASMNGRITVIKFLISKGATKNIINDHGKTPYDLACNFPYADISQKDQIKQILKE